MKKLVICSVLFLLSFVHAGQTLAAFTVVGGLIRDSTVEPGERAEGIIHVRNSGKQDVEVKIFRADYLFTADGQTLYGNPGSTPRSNAEWVSLSPSRVNIPAGDMASVYYTIEVPEDSLLDGTYWSVVMIEPAVDPVLPTIKEEEGKVTLGVQAVIRYAIQIVTNIGDSGERNIRFMKTTFVGDNGQRLLQSDIENTGTRCLSPFVWAELYNEDGLYIGRFESERLRIYPNCSVRHRVDLTDVPVGAYKALLIVDNGDEHVFGANYDLLIEQ